MFDSNTALVQLAWKLNLRILWAVSFFTGTISDSLASTATADRKFSYCVGVEVDLNPFRQMKDPQELYYELLVTRSFISTNTNEPGLLESWYFSPNGKTFRAKISRSALWNDGTMLSARDAAFAIAKGLRYRPLGKKVRVVGTERIDDPDWVARKYDGINILENDVFELRFESEIENLTGVLKEALSSNSRHNRLWPIKIDDFRINRKYHDVISKFPLKYAADGTLELSVEGSTVALVASEKCKGADFFPGTQNFHDNASEFSKRSSRYPQLVLAFMNTSKNSLEKRQSLLSWIRRTVSESLDASLESSHFRKQEPGFVSSLNWSELDKTPKYLPKKIFIASSTSIPVHHRIRESMLRLTEKSGSKLVWIDANINDQAPPETDVIIWFSRLETDRQIWTQDILSYPTIQYFLAASPASKSSLEIILQKSAATIPVDNITLQNLEINAYKEKSIVPISRIYKEVLSRKSLPIELTFTEQDEFTFIRRSVHD